MEEAWGDLYDEKDFWESGEYCKFCGHPLPQVIHGEYECPECGTIYPVSGQEVTNKKPCKV